MVAVGNLQGVGRKLAKTGNSARLMRTTIRKPFGGLVLGGVMFITVGGLGKQSYVSFITKNNPPPGPTDVMKLTPYTTLKHTTVLTSGPTYCERTKQNSESGHCC